LYQAAELTNKEPLHTSLAWKISSNNVDERATYKHKDFSRLSHSLLAIAFTGARRSHPEDVQRVQKI
jgi:hypothetical protein